MSFFDNKTVLVIDHGLYPHVAVKLAETFGRVSYFVPWTENGFPSSKRRQIGTGIPNVERVYEMWDAVAEADLIVACDVYFWDIVHYLRQQGKRVWGAGHAEGLEVARLSTKQLMDSIGMNVIPYEVADGVNELWNLVRDREDLWIKGSNTRGDLETFHWENEHVSSPRLEKLLRDIGPRRSTMQFIVEESVPGCEIGFDGYSVDGQFGAISLYGYEVKDAGFGGRVCTFDELPEVVKGPTLEIASIMGQLGCRGFFSNEIRVAEDGTSYLIDPCMRCGSPPSESYMELFSNWDEVIWAGAHGDLVSLLPTAGYAAQIVLKSDWVTDDEYLPVYFPSTIDRYVKLHNYCVYDGEFTVVPQDFPEFGSVIGFGNTMDEAEQAALSHVEQVQALELDWKRNVFDELNGCIRKGRKVGIDWD